MANVAGQVFPMAAIPNGQPSPSTPNARKRPAEDFDFQTAFKKMQSELIDHSDKSTQALAAKFTETCQKNTALLDEAFQRRFADVDRKIDDHESRMALLESRMAASTLASAVASSRLDDVQRDLGNLKSPLPPSQDIVDAEAFERKTDPALVCARTGAPTTLADVEHLVVEILREMDLDEDVATVCGPRLGKQFHIRFIGQLPLAAKRVGQFLARGRIATGFREFHAPTAAGGQSRVYFDIDKSPKQNRAELVCRKMLARLRAVDGNARFFHKKAESVLYAGWTPVARILDVTKDSYRVEWCIAKADELGLNRATIEQAVRDDLTNPSANVLWG